MWDIKTSHRKWRKGSLRSKSQHWVFFDEFAAQPPDWMHQWIGGPEQSQKKIVVEGGTDNASGWPLNRH
jgi:hypothetical protein